MTTTAMLRGAPGARVAAQAKVNLRLRVLAREASGYHQIETLFLRLDLADEIVLRRTDSAKSLDVRGDVDTAAIGPAEGNLAWRAAEAFLAAAGMTGGFAIELVKRIPIGGGLGGGSADAAGVLRLLNAIAPTPLDDARLLGLAASLGADVPFLASEHVFALGWGRGERLLALAPPPARDVILLVPDFGVNTAAAYGWLAEQRGADPAPPEPVLQPAELSRWEALETLAINDFQPVVAARHPGVATLVDALHAAGCRPALMSGSGSVVFGVWRADVADRPARSPRARAISTRTAMRVEPVQPLR